jgi:transposase
MEAIVDPPFRGSRLDADHPQNGVLIPCRSTQDLAAVQAALDLPWTTSPVEGQINRLKMLKRTMYGRAGFELLRRRVLYAA